MEKITKNNINFFSKIKNFFQKNIKFLTFGILILVILISIFQIYIFIQKQKILKMSIEYNNLFDSNLNIDLSDKLYSISKENNFYGLLASLELINNKISKNNFNESYNDYIDILDNRRLNSEYKTLIAVHGAYNLLNKIDSEKILNLLSFMDEKIISFNGYKLEILFLLNIDNNKLESENLYNQIIENPDISQSIKNRVNKINEFEKYK